MRGIEEWKNLQGNNLRRASYHGDTFEEFMALVELADSGILWQTESCGPCGSNTIRTAKTNNYPGPFPLIDDPECKWTMGCEGTDGDLICAQHNRAMVKLYLTITKSKGDKT